MHKYNFKFNFLDYLPVSTPIYVLSKSLYNKLVKSKNNYRFVDFKTKNAGGSVVLLNSKNEDDGIYNFAWKIYIREEIFNLSIPTTFNYDLFTKNTKTYFNTKRTYNRDSIIIDGELNPKIVVEKHGDFNVVRDDLLYGGTKQRALLQYANFMEAHKYDCIIYAGPPEGVAQVALGIIAKKLGKTAYMFYVSYEKKDWKEYPMSCKANKVGVNLILGGKSLKEATPIAQDFAKKNNGLLMPFGLDDPNFKGMLVDALREATPEELRNEKIVLWTIVGSGLLLNVFYEVFPNAYIIGVRAGKPIYADGFDITRTLTLTSPYDFGAATKELPPYPTVPSYDGKVWEMAKEYKKKIRFVDSNSLKLETFERRHFIWNVASDIL